MELHSYGSVYNIGHKAIAEIWDDDVVIEEKVDGSQFIFGVLDNELYCRSKGAALYFDKNGKCSTNLFQKAIDTAIELFRLGLLSNRTTYYGEYLQKNKHNVLKYSRTPKGNIIIFDISVGGQDFIMPDIKKQMCKHIGLECVPLLKTGRINDFESMKNILQTESCLGDTLIEGFVVKNYRRFTLDKKYMKGKFVSEAFKETHRKEWKAEGNKKEIVQMIIETLRNPARWEKAILHLRESGEITNTLNDIGILFQEVPKDIEKEEIDWIKDQLYKHFKSNILRGCTSGLAEWYKDRLAQRSFND